MPLIPALIFEKKIQANDKTRYNARKSFATKGTDPITIMTITPGMDKDPIDIFDAELENQYLDWAFTDTTFDIGPFNQTIYLEADGEEMAAAVDEDTYDDLDALVTAIQTGLNASSSGFVVTKNERNQLTISRNGQFKLNVLRKEGSLLPHIGFNLEMKAFSNEITGTPVEYAIKKVTLSLNNPLPLDPEDEEAEPPTEEELAETVVTKDYYVQVYQEAGDALYSDDSDLLADEPDIMNWVPEGRATFLDVHRKAQERILNYLDKNGYVDVNGIKLNKFSIVDHSEVALWSKYLALQLIYESNHNAENDVFAEKAAAYEKLALIQAERIILRVDVDGDGVEDPDQSPSISSGELFRR